MNTNELMLLFHNARGDKERTREIIKEYCTPINNPPDMEEVEWLGYFIPKRGKPVYICNDTGQIIALTEDDYQTVCNE